MSSNASNHRRLPNASEHSRSRRGAPAFRIDAKHLALTYANMEQQSLGSADLAANPYTLETFFRDLRYRLRDLGRDFIYVAACRESHADGSTHFHAGVRLERKWHISDPRALDLRGGFHPNIQSARHFAKWITYLKKDGEFLEDGDYDEPNKDKDSRITPEELMELARSSEQAEFLAYCSVHKYFGGKDIWNLVHEDKSLTLLENTPIDGTIDPNFTRLTENFAWRQNLTLLIIGESGIGKSLAFPNTYPS